jgi:signal transduction histidine kinase
MISFNRDLLKNILVMLGFGILSMFLGYIRFTIPGMDGAGSDLREIGVLISVLFLPNWIYMLGVSFVASLSFPLNNLQVSTIFMHCTASLFAWFFYTFIKGKTKNLYLLAGQWAFMVIVYYIIFLVPTLIIVYYLFRIIRSDEIFTSYVKVLSAYRFELFATTIVTTLFLLLYKINNILEIKNKELEVALIKSEESDKLKTSFLNNINHEIRTPLNGIIGFTNLITEPDLNNEQRVDYGKMIVSSSEQLLSIISNIIDISKIKTGQVKLRTEHVSVNELFYSIYLHYLPLAKEKNLLFKAVPVEAGVDDIIFTDKSALKQILENLLNNAFKFTKKGSVKMLCIKSDDHATFCVEDTGPGMDLSLHEKIFEHFYKFENENERFLPGTGLGLSISKSLAELLGGNIYIKSEPGNGSVFSFTIPCNLKEDSV